MHELPVVGEVVKIAVKHAEKHQAKKIVAIHLLIGDLTDLVDEWVQRYFKFVAEDTIARDAQLVIERAPITLFCDNCKKQYVAEKKEFDFACPDCSDKGTTLIGGKEFTVQSIEIQ